MTASVEQEAAAWLQMHPNHDLFVFKNELNPKYFPIQEVYATAHAPQRGGEGWAIKLNSLTKQEAKHKPSLFHAPTGLPVGLGGAWAFIWLPGIRDGMSIWRLEDSAVGTPRWLDS